MQSGGNEGYDGWLRGAREIGPGTIFHLNYSKLRKLSEFDGFFIGKPLTCDSQDLILQAILSNGFATVRRS